ncbi:MAG: type II secretion system F family protein [Marinicaulis sp.]|nr:type II secretion system F family protein [Marinicaulis sp.]NNL89715.1 type II secretion system F family protein [Marinicaulis sp.]
MDNSTIFLIQGATFLAVALFVLGAFALIRRDPALSRLIPFAGGAKEPSGGEGVSVVYDENRHKAIEFLKPFQKRFAQSDEKQTGIVAGRLVQAGFYARSAIEVYYSIRIFLAVALVLIAGISVFTLLPPMPSQFSLLFTIGAATIGYYLPALILSSRISERQTDFRRGMPDAMDMILVGVEAGLSLPAAIQHLCNEMADAHPIITEQFHIIGLEFQAGKSRAEALSGLSRRIDIPEARNFTTMIIQSEALGTSLAQTLRVIADEMRTNRMLEAEKKATELPVKMAIPLVLLIFPALFSVIMAPLMIRIMAALVDPAAS